MELPQSADDPVKEREESSRKRERHGRVTRQDELRMGGTCLQPEVSPRPEWVAEVCPTGGTQPVLRSLSNTLGHTVTTVLSTYYLMYPSLARAWHLLY